MPRQLREERLRRIAAQIQLALRDTSHNLNAGIQCLNRLINMKIDRIVLKKYPLIIKIVQKVSNFTASVPKDFSRKKRIEFFGVCRIIRTKARIVLKKFQRAYGLPCKKCFQRHFVKMRNLFLERTKDLSMEEYWSLFHDDNETIEVVCAHKRVPKKYAVYV